MKTYCWLLLAVASAVGTCQDQPAQTPGEKAAREAQDKAAAELKVEKEISLDLGNKLKLELVLIPPGKFEMGGEDIEKGPLHEVTFNKAFYMAKCEVTQEQYEAVMANNPSKAKSAKYPVDQLSWNEADEFCKKLSAKMGKTVRLPTDAEWEYASRAGGERRRFVWDWDHDLADSAMDNPDAIWQPSREKPNAWGMEKTYRRVTEWCQDWQKDWYPERNKDMRILRGGWDNYPWFCKFTDRVALVQDDRMISVGFRVMMAMEPKIP